MDARRFMYAFHLDCPANAAYSCYLSDLSTVWAETCSSEEVAEKARGLGILRVDGETLRYLGNELHEAFYENGNVLIKSSGDHYVVSVELSNLTWEMRLQKLDANGTAAFLATFNVSQFANHSYLAYKASQLEKALRAKDKYILYLEENYKTVNGTALMDKYKRQNSGDAPLLEPYSRRAFESRVHELYGSLARKLEADPSSWPSLLWDVISSVFQDVLTWTAGLWIHGEGAQEDPKVKTEPKIKRDPDKNTEQRVLNELKMKTDPKVKSEPKVKVESGTEGNETDESDATKKGDSSGKRRRVGIVGRKRPSNDSEESDASEKPASQKSPTKRRRVGVIGRR